MIQGAATEARCRDPASWLDEVRAFDAAVAGGTLKVVFGTGMARSGTTWLNELLAQHPDVSEIGEAYFFNEYLKSVPEGLAKYPEESTIGLRRFLPESEIARSLRPMVFWALIRAVPNWRQRRVIIEKTPDTENFAGLLLKIVPEAYVMHIVRDPRAVIASWRVGSRTWSRGWGRHRSIELAHKWVQSVASRTEIRRLTDRFHTLRYEDLHADGVGSLLSIFSWLGIAARDEDCAGYVESCRIENMRARGASTKAKSDRRRWSGDFLRRGEVGGWQADLGRREIVRIEHVARETMLTLGYEPTTRRHAWLPSIALYHASLQLVHRARMLALRMRR